MIVTFNKGGVYHGTKKLGIATLDSSHEHECIATCKGAEGNAYVREVLRALGIPIKGPTPILTDNAANMRVSQTAGNASRSKHFLRRYWSLLRRIAEGEAVVKFVSDRTCPADFLTKWVPSRKLRDSELYAENSSNAVGREAAAHAAASALVGADGYELVLPAKKKRKQLRDPAVRAAAAAILAASQRSV